jgi:hypothetical protein
MPTPAVHGSFIVLIDISVDRPKLEIPEALLMFNGSAEAAVPAV